MSPTVFRDGHLRFAFFSNEEPRCHVHVWSPDGEAKVWIEPTIELAYARDISKTDVRRALELIKEREQEIRDAWDSYFADNQR